MNHFDEMACMLLPDQQLEPERARELIHHTTTWCACRALLRFVGSGKRLASLGADRGFGNGTGTPDRGSRPLANALGMDYSFRFGGKRLLHFVERLIAPGGSSSSDAGLNGSNLLAVLVFQQRISGKDGIQCETLIEFIALAT